MFPGNKTNSELNGFSNASDKGYDEAVYLRSVVQGKNQSAFLCGKFKVAPLKSVSVPHFEVCAEVLLFHLNQFIS